jgi:hypothetical protein
MQSYNLLLLFLKTLLMQKTDFHHLDGGKMGLVIGDSIIFEVGILTAEKS